MSQFDINRSVVLGFIVDVFSLHLKICKNTKETFATYNTTITPCKHAFLFSTFELWGGIPCRTKISVLKCLLKISLLQIKLPERIASF